MIEMKPCPFCGNDGTGPIEDALHVVFNEHDWRDHSWSVQCDKCTATMGYSDSEDEAIDHWNTRQNISDVLIEALEGLAAGSIDVSGTALIYEHDPRELLEAARDALRQAKGGEG